jgi:hypothetical protein
MDSLVAAEHDAAQTGIRLLLRGLHGGIDEPAMSEVAPSTIRATVRLATTRRVLRRRKVYQLWVSTWMGRVVLKAWCREQGG